MAKYERYGNAESTNLELDDILDRLKVIRYQEERYRRVNYSLTNNKRRFDQIESELVDEICRVKMCQWCYQVVDHCQFSRNCVSIGFSFLDRYLSTKEGRSVLESREMYQLASMTALYMAIKIHDAVKMDAESLAEFSHGLFSKDQVEAMEKSILSALEWRLCEPTSIEFILCVMALMPKSVPPEVVSSLTDRAKYQAEISVAEISFIDSLPSEIGMAAIFNAIAEVDKSTLSPEERTNFFLRIEYYTGLRTNKIVTKIQSTLSLLVVGISPATVEQDVVMETNDNKDGSYEHSPVAIIP